MDRGDNSLSIGVPHSRKDPCFLSALQFLSLRSGNVHSGRDRSSGDTGDSNNGSPGIGQIERRVADLWKEQEIPRLLTVFLLTFVFCAQRNSPEKSYDDDDGDTPPDDSRARKERSTTPRNGRPRARMAALQRALELGSSSM